MIYLLSLLNLTMMLVGPLILLITLLYDQLTALAVAQAAFSIFYSYKRVSYTSKLLTLMIIELRR